MVFLFIQRCLQEQWGFPGGDDEANADCDRRSSYSKYVVNSV